MPDDSRRMEAEEKYVAGKMTLRDLAKETGISLSALGKWSRERKWGKKRQKFQEKALKKAVNRAVDKKARELAKLMEASDEIETALLTAAKAFRAKMLEDESGTLLTDGKFRAGNLGSVVNAIGRQTETRKTLAGLLADDRKENGVTVELAPETRELAD